MAKKSITVNINGAPRSGDVEDRLLLVHFIRDDCSLKLCTSKPSTL